MSLKAKITKKTTAPTIDTLVDQLTTLSDDLRELEDSHSEVFEQYRHITETIEGVKERIKIEARKMAKEGETVVVVDNAKVHIDVQAKTKRSYSYSDAKRVWPSKVLEFVSVTYIDNKLVQDAIESGKLEERLAGKVLRLEPMTAAVSIKVST